MRGRNVQGSAPDRERADDGRRWWADLSRPAVAWAWVSLVLLTCTALVQYVLQVEFLDQTQAGFFRWDGTLALALLGLLGAWVSGHTGFAAPWGPAGTNWRRVVVPTALGVGFGVLLLALDAGSNLTRLQRETMGVESTDIAFPGSLVVYTAAAVYLEVVFRLVFIPVLLWLLSTVLLRGRHQEPVFWGLAVLTSLIEPVTQAPGTSIVAPVWFVCLLGTTFAANLAQAALFRRYGFLAAILMRVALYVVWHVLGAPLK